MSNLKKSSYYVSGSAAPRREVRTLPKRRRASQTSMQVLQRQERELSFDRKKMNGMIPYVLLLFVLCIFYVSMHQRMLSKMEMVTIRQEEYSQLKTKNDARYNEIMSNVSLENIRYRAIHELNMVYPAEGQVVYFRQSGGDYVQQFSEFQSENN